MSVNRRPKWNWPNGSRLAVWVIQNLALFSLTRRSRDTFEKKAQPYKALPVWASGQRDYGSRVGGFRMMEGFAEQGIRATATINTDLCDHPASLRTR
jgi:allantoinase